MTRTLHRAAAALALLAATALPGDAAAADRASVAMPFTADRPATTTGIEFHIRFGDGSAKPPALDAAEYDLPAGTRLDPSAVPACDATDEQLRARARDACPAESQVGTGTLEAVTGFGPPGDPVRTDVAVFNTADGLLEVVTFEGTNAYAGSDRLTLEGHTLRAHPPAVPGGPPDGRTTIREIRLRLPARTGSGGRPYMTTPPTCPADGRWRGEGRFTFAGGGTARAPAEQPCRATVPGAGTPAGSGLAVRVLRERRPALIAGRAVRVRVRVASAAAACRGGATVRVAGRRATTDARGRAELRVRVRRARRARVVVTKPGCGRAVTVLPVARR